jgi:hypothetical protein
MPGYRVASLKSYNVLYDYDLLQLRVLTRVSVEVCIDGILLLNVEGSHVFELGAGRYD